MVCSTAARLGVFPIGQRLQTLLLGRSFIRVVNYHATPAEHAARFEEQMRFFVDAFSVASEADLDACIAGNWRPPKPGILVTFDDGFRSNLDVAVPILERYGLRGWFFVPSGLIAETRDAADAAFRAGGHDDPEPRLSWPECRAMAERGHVIGCHTHTHLRLADKLTPEVLHDEITLSRQRMQARMGLPVDDFCWVGGEEQNYGSGAYVEIGRAGFRRSFMTNLLPVLPGSSPMWIQRTNVEADWPRANVEFYLSGLMDLAYWPKRRRLRRKLAAA